MKRFPFLRFLPGGVLALKIVCSADAQTVGAPNEGTRLTFDMISESYDFSWWGKSGRTYFIQQSDDLLTWGYLPMIESGANDLLSWGFTSTADKFFLRLRYTDIATSDPYYGDFDGDKINNYDELWAGTDPLRIADTDVDGIPDDWETFYDLDPNDPSDASLDTDNDGLSNLQEFQYGAYPYDADSDFDGLTDGQEVTLGTDPLSYDSDGDGTPDGEEDADADGMANQWEFNHQLNPLVSDGALDSDSDGLTNLQEFQHDTDPHQSDSDSDGLSDANEVNVRLTDPAQYDTDSDGYNDGWEIRFGFNPLVDNTNDSDLNKRPNTDADGDGLTNLEEEQIDTNPGNADTDGDGYSDSAEGQGGSNPNDSGSTPPYPGGPGTTAIPMVSMSFTFGDPSGSHSEKYRVILTPLEGDPNTQSRHRTNQKYGQLQTESLNLPKGAKYSVTLVHIGTDPRYQGKPKPDYDYELRISGGGSGDSAVLTEDPQRMLGFHTESTPFFASGKNATLSIAWLTSQTVAATPTDRKRTKLGVGEEVDLKVTPSANSITWSVSANGALNRTTGIDVRLTESDDTGTTTVTVNYEGLTLTKAFSVVAPTGVDSAKVASTETYPIGTQGAGMHLYPVVVGPTDVSFYRVQMLEVGRAASSITGYFTTNAPISHIGNGADAWFVLDEANQWPSDYDYANLYNYPSPWSPGGGFTWVIPAKWKVGSSGTEHTITGWDQVFELQSNGTTTIRKFGHSVTRTVNDVSTSN